MQKFRFHLSFRVLALLLFASFLFVLFSACSYSSTENTIAIQSSSTYIDEEITQAFLERYVTSLDIALTGENDLVFTDPKTLSTSTLFLFFLQTSFQEYAENNPQSHGDAGEVYKKSDGRYHIPVQDIEELLSRYFTKDTDFCPYSLSGYNEDTQEICVSIFGGFGGARNIKLLSSKRFHNTLTLEVGFYENSDLTKLLYCKEYVLKKENDHYQYQSIRKKYSDASVSPSFIALKYGIIGMVSNGEFLNLVGGENALQNCTSISAGEVLDSEFSVYSSQDLSSDKTPLTSNLLKSTFWQSNKSIKDLQFSKSGIQKGILWQSNPNNALPRPVEIAKPDTREYRLTQDFLSDNFKISCEYSLSDVFSADLDQDGTSEHIFSANTVLDHQTSLPCGVVSGKDQQFLVKDEHRVFSFVFLEKSGVLTPLFQKVLGSGEYSRSDLLFSSFPLGLYDLNGDGNMEICIEHQLGNIPVVQVYHQSEKAYQVVLDASFPSIKG